MGNPIATNPIAAALGSALTQAFAETEKNRIMATAHAKGLLLKAMAWDISDYAFKAGKFKDTIISVYQGRIAEAQREDVPDHFAQYRPAVLQDIAREPLSYSDRPWDSSSNKGLKFQLGHHGRADDVRALMNQNSEFDQAVKKLLYICDINDFAVSIATRDGVDCYDEFDNHVLIQASVEIRILPGMTFVQSEVSASLKDFIDSARPAKTVAAPAAAP